MACAIVARGCVYGMQEFLDVASKEFMDEFFEVSMIFRRMQCRKNEEQDWKRKGKTNTTNRRRGEFPIREAHLYLLRHRIRRRNNRREERVEHCHFHPLLATLLEWPLQTPSRGLGVSSRSATSLASAWRCLLNLQLHKHADGDAVRSHLLDRRPSGQHS